MAEYFNQVGCGIAEVALVKLMHMVDGEVESTTEHICHIELIPHIITLLQETYNKHMERVAQAQQINNTNKGLS